MTAPTQAQIEAAAVLSAAAEVGEKWPLIITTDEEIGQKLNATIERCAQVADDYAACCPHVAAAIRALKDKP